MKLDKSEQTDKSMDSLKKTCMIFFLQLLNMTT
jgi:hypothetical protein